MDCIRTDTYTVGRVLCGKVRDNLAKAKFTGDIMDYHESTGFIEREFAVKTGSSAPSKFHRWFKASIETS